MCRATRVCWHGLFIALHSCKARHAYVPQSSHSRTPTLWCDSVCACCASRRWRKQSPKVQAKVTLNLPLTQDVMQGLPALPAWSGTLVLDDATWPLPPTDYTTLVQHIPTSYNRWELGEDIDRHSELFKCIAAGVNATRRALGLGPLTVVLPGYRPRQYGKRELEEGTDVRIEPARGEGY